MARSHSPWTYAGITAGLLTLLALSVLVAHINLGSLNALFGLLIASAKAMLVLLFFMRLLRSGKSCAIALLVGLFMLAIACTLAMTDYAARDRFGQQSVGPERGS